MTEHLVRKTLHKGGWSATTTFGRLSVPQ